MTQFLMMSVIMKTIYVCVCVMIVNGIRVMNGIHEHHNILLRRRRATVASPDPLALSDSPPLHYTVTLQRESKKCTTVVSYVFLKA